MANPPKGKAKAKPAAAKKPASRSGKATASRAKAKPVDAGQKYVVSGTVTYADSTPAVGLTVIAYDKDVSGKDNLGQPVVTKESGTFAIPYSDADFRRTKEERGGADVIVCVYNAEKELLFTSKKQNNAPANYELNIKLPAQLFVVRGTVRFADGTPLAGALVRAFDRDLRKEQQLGKDETTDDRGQYIIRYGAEEFATGDVSSAIAPKLIVRAFAGDQQIDKDVVRPKPTRDEVVDFKVSAPALSEWEKVSAGVIPLLKGQGEGDQTLPPWEINDSDLNFIAEETGLDREQIRLWALAFAVGREALEMQPAEPISTDPMTHLPVTGAAGDLSTFAIFYGWFRLGLPSDLAELWSRSTDSLITECKKSIEANLVPRVLSDQFVVLEATINQLKAARVLAPAPEGTPSSLGDLLGTLPPGEALSNDQQLIFAKLRNEYGDTDNLWKQAEASGLSTAIPALKRTIALDELTEGHALLVNALQTKLDAKHPESLEFLTALEPIDWIELVFEHGVPPGIELDRDNYIAQLQAGVETKFSMRMLTKQLETRFIESERFPAREVLDFFEANPGFDIKAQHVEPYLDNTENQDDIILREGLLQLQRIHVVTSNAYETGVLLDVGYSSATQIFNEGMPALELKVVNQMSPERTAEVFATAENIVTTVALVATTYVSPSASGNAVHVIPARSVSDETLKKYPSLRSLFGDLDYCECRHCQSVLGPAAYLADLMHFLQRSKLSANPDGRLADANLGLYYKYLELDAKGSVLGALVKRRPDLADLEFSCENTDTKIPYIDLVLEILENAAALPMALVVEGVDINAKFTNGEVPVKVAQALRKTNINVGKTLTVTPGDSPLSSISPSLDWIITDGSRRWVVQHRKQQHILLTDGAGHFQVLDVAGAADSLKNGKLNAELEGKLSQGLPIHGAPQIKEFPTPDSIQAWVASYTRAIAIKITMGVPMGSVELLKLDGTRLKAYQWPTGTMRAIAQAVTSGTTTKINTNVAQLLGLPANETYLQTWNPAQNWWELSVTNTAFFLHLLEGLDVSGLTHQNSSIREHLQSSSENRNPLAYDILASEKTVYPWALPFDLWLEETRAFLDALGVSRTHLIDIARPQSHLPEEAAILELFGFSKSEAELITSATAPNKPWIYWGLAQENNVIKDHTAGSVLKGDWQGVLVHLSMLLQQSGLSYREYLDFLQTRFGGQTKLALSPPNECKTSQILLTRPDFITPLTEGEVTNHLNQVHVFTRLWRKSGWSMRDLDLALTAFGGQITPTILQDLALLKRLSTGLGLPVSLLVGCIDELDTQTWTNHTKVDSSIEPSLYNSVFQRQSLRSLTAFDDFAFEKLNTPTPPSISDRADFIAASLGIKPEQVKAWITALSPRIADRVKLDSLSRLYAAVSLCRGLRIAPEILPDIVKLLGPDADVFPTLPAPATSVERAGQTRTRALAMLEFVERVEFVRKSGFDFETLSYLLRHKVLPGKGTDASTKIEQQLTQMLTELRSALQAGVVLGDVSAENLKRQLASLGWYPSLINAAMGSEGLTYQPGASVEINPPLPTSEPAIPLNLRSKFTYQKVDATKAMLACSGSIIDTDFASIDSLFPVGLVTALKTKYDKQLDDQTKALASLLQIIELEKLPTVTEALSGLTALPVIPEELKDHIKFEMDSASATRGNLTLTGWLSNAEKKILTAANLSLSVVVNKLQVNARKIPEPTPPQTLKDAEQLLREPDLEKRYRSILLRLVPRLELDLLVAQLNGVLGSDQQVAARLLGVKKANTRSARDVLTDSEFLRPGLEKPLDRKTYPDQFAMMELLGKITTIANRLTITLEQLDWVLSKAFTVLDVFALPTDATAAAADFDSWRKLVDLFRLRDILPDVPARLTTISKALKTSDFIAVRKEFADAFELNVDEAGGACSAELLAFKGAAPAEDYRNPSRLLALAQLLHVIKTLGTTAVDVTRLVQPAPDQAVAQLARTLFAASIDAKEFPERLRPISNRLRNLQRDALVAYLIHRDRLADSNDLFDRYLIDVEMDSCMLTSRIKQAISSVQLFVQRCLLNLERPATDANGFPLEPGVSPVSINTQRWQWMKSYRVWEANRKVFLYPENWIEPELRDDKSEIFRAFESDLQQSEITHDTALMALRKYLDKMGDIANLTVVSMFEEQIGDGVSIVHLVGRDNSTPYKHYYRQWKLRSNTEFGTWTAWEEISAQVDSEHVLVFLYGGSVYLAWPTISSGQKGNLKWKIGMNLAKRSAAGWTKLKKGRGEIEVPMAPHKNRQLLKNIVSFKNYRDERNSIAFRLKYAPDKTAVSIETYGPPFQETGEEPNKTERETISDDHDTDRDKTVPRKLIGTVLCRDPHITLNLRALASYTYEYANNVKETRYQLMDDLKMTITVTAKTMNGIPGKPYDGFVTRPYTVEKNVVRHDDLFSLFLFISLHTKQRDPNSLTETKDDLVDVFNMVVEVIPPAKYKTDKVKPLKKVFPVSKGSSFAWQEDFIFELAEDPGWLPSGNPTLIKAGSFSLDEEDSLELEPANGTLLLIPVGIDPVIENFMSGYREIDGTHGLALERVPGANLQVTALKTTPGQYFIADAQSDGSSTRQIWAYHDDQDSLLFWKSRVDTKYRVVPFSTGGMRDLTSKVTKGKLLEAVSLPGILALAPTRLLDVDTGIDFIPITSPDFASSNSVTQIGIDFEKVPTSIYNWEVFFHNPLMVATQLSQAQRFEEAQRWFHLIFDPTTNQAGKESIRYWRFLPFREAGEGVAIDKLLEDLAQGDTSLREQIDKWADNPFRPHLIARYRLRSYQFAVVQKYLENLIAWGDQIFRRDTIESINEATQLYVLASKILGKRPASAPKTKARPKSYRDIFHKLDDLSNAWIPLEGPIATAVLASYPKGTGTPYREGDVEIPPILKFLGGLYFCIPGNEKLSEYWDTVEDRLFKIRHCMNIEGIERQLPLFEPPIDPALLVRATAAGLDLATVLSELQAPLPLYRFNVMVQKALDLCGEVRALGNALLSALEKKDAEQLSLLRSSHEIKMLKLVRAIKEQQQEEADTNLEALRKTREITAQRYVNYQRLMGKQNVVVPVEGTVATLESSTLQLAPPSAGDTDTQGLALISAESGHMAWLTIGNDQSQIAGNFNTMAAVAHIVPDFGIGTPPYLVNWGGSHVGSALNAVGSYFSTLASNASFQANRSSIIGGHQRRYDEWRFQSNTASKELEQIDKQILANEIRKQIAAKEITNHDQQIENTQEVDEFMRDKFTNQQLYSWMVGQISKVYFRTYQLAHDMAKRAERTYRFELGLKDKDSSFIEFGYWDSLKKGLLSGERLYLDLKRMDAAYLDKNKREYEITKHVSLMQLDPIALLQLKETGQCEVSLPEALFDIDYPGHYMRRIKSVSLTIPCVTGPYASVNCTLTQLSSSIRHANTLSGGKYGRGPDDTRFSDSFGSIQSIVTSSGQNDSGLFETNLRDERYLPFEGQGAISTWRIQLPMEFKPFDYDTISDVVLHLRYTARDGGGALRQQATMELSAAVNAIVQAAGEQGLARVFSLRHEFPTEWAQLTQASAGARSAKFSISKNRFPFFVQQKTLTVNQVDLFGVPLKDSSPPPTTLPTLKRLNLPVSTEAGALFGSLLHRTARNLQVTIQTENNTNSEWELTTTNIADIGKLKDIIVVFGYTASGVS